MQISRALDARNLAKISGRITQYSTRALVAPPKRLSGDWLLGRIALSMAVFGAAFLFGHQTQADRLLVTSGLGAMVLLGMILAYSDRSILSHCVSECAARPWKRVALGTTLGLMSLMTSLALFLVCLNATQEYGEFHSGEACLLIGAVVLALQTWEWTSLALGREDIMKSWFNQG